eukprot:24726-Eustigmatos_ZCMA.PRE.1
MHAGKRHDPLHGLGREVLHDGQDDVFARLAAGSAASVDGIVERGLGAGLNVGAGRVRAGPAWRWTDPGGLPSVCRIRIAIGDQISHGRHIIGGGVE